MSNEAQKKSSSISAENEALPLILAVETATRAGGVAVARGDKILASASGDPSASHSTDLIGNLDAVLHEARTELTAVDLFAVAIGPGSFTGLRIGLATVKSFAVALDRKCAAVPTLAAVAYAAGDSARTVALLPAGRGEVFAQMFSVNETVDPLDDPAHISPVALLSKYGLHAGVLWAGEGAHVQIDILKAGAAERAITFHESAPGQSAAGWTLAPSQERLAEAVALLGFQKWRAADLVAPEALQANYVRASDAELKSNV